MLQHRHRPATSRACLSCRRSAGIADQKLATLSDSLQRSRCRPLVLANFPKKQAPCEDLVCLFSPSNRPTAPETFRVVTTGKVSIVFPISENQYYKKQETSVLAHQPASKRKTKGTQALQITSLTPGAALSPGRGETFLTLSSKPGSQMITKSRSLRQRETKSPSPHPFSLSYLDLIIIL